MEEEKKTAQEEAFACTRDVENRYYKQVCETVFQNSKHRPWCRGCPHFTAAAGTENEKSEPPPESAKQQA
jgi:hypothetical protein